MGTELDPAHPPTAAIKLPTASGALDQHIYRALPAVDRVEAVVSRLHDSIAIGIIQTGDRLPSEAEMSESFGVSPATLREALAQLRDRGLVETRRGRNGGTFVVDTPVSSRDAVSAKLDTYSVADLRDIGDQRSAISGMCARLAATRSSEDNCERLRHLANELRHAVSTDQQARVHSRFWLELTVAAQSRRLLALELPLQLEIADLLWTPISRQRNIEAISDSLHQIIDAIEARDGDAAESRTIERIQQDSYHLIDEKLTLAMTHSAEGN